MSEDRPPLPYDPREIREKLQRQILGVLSSLGVNDQPSGGMVTPLNPTRVDRRPGSFVIDVTRAPGAWNEYATGEKGDVYGLIQYLGRLQAWIDAYWWALDFLNLQRGVVRSKAEDQAARERAERDKAAAAAKAAKIDAARSAELKQMWLGLAPFPGTLVETYLTKSRGIELARLGHVPGALRFAPDLEHIDQESGEVTAWPAMVAAMNVGPAIVSIHRTWLRPDGLAKAPVAKAKMMLGPCRGAAIRLTPGASGLSPGAAAKKGRADPLLIGEGIETTLTLACAVPEYRAWAAGSLVLMRGFDWPACASAVILLRDNDWKPEAVAAFAKVEAHWRAQAQGRPVKVVASPEGSDFNDLVKGRAA